jgi:hypothetical protein
MLKTLHEIYKESRYYDRQDSARLRDFTMLGGNDFSVILPSHWESVVRPGLQVTMRFDERFLNDVSDPRGKIRRFWNRTLKR